jgi:hypothetical protein
LCKGVEDTTRECLLVLKTSPYLLTLLTVNDSSTRVLTERQYTLNSCLCIAEELESYVLVIL